MTELRTPFFCRCLSLLIFVQLTLLEPLAKAERLPKKFENMCAVGQPVEQGSCQMFFPHHRIPVPKFEIGGNDQSTSFVEGRAELEEQMSALTAERNEAKFIQDQQIVLTLHMAAMKRESFKSCWAQIRSLTKVATL